MSTLRYGAFFDLDGTLIHTRSLLSFLQYAKAAMSSLDQRRIDAFERELKERVRRQDSRASVNRFFYTWLAGQKLSNVVSHGLDWAVKMHGCDTFYNQGLLRSIALHQAGGASIVMVTGSCRALAEPLAQRLGIDAVLCTALETTQGILTGEVVGQPCIGQGKLDAMLRFAAEHEIDLKESFAYGDDISDQPMLNAVGWPSRVLASNAYKAELEAYLAQ